MEGECKIHIDEDALRLLHVFSCFMIPKSMHEAGKTSGSRTTLVYMCFLQKMSIVQISQLSGYCKYSNTLWYCKMTKFR